MCALVTGVQTCALPICYVVAWLGVFAVLLSPVAAGSIGKIDIRLSISAGILWMAFVSILRASWNADVDYWTLAWPHILQGTGMPFFFVGLTALALSSVPAQDQTKRSEHRRVGKECVGKSISPWSPDNKK